MMGKTVPCPSCGKKMHLTEGEEEDAQEQDVLEEVDAALHRMIKGIFLFTFDQLPRHLSILLKKCFPYTVKLIRVCAKLLLWILLTAGPFAWVITARVALQGKEDGVIGWYNTNRTLWEVVLCLWSGLASLGSIWSFLYLHHKRKRKPLAASSDARS
jgi:hypothetical protein